MGMDIFGKDPDSEEGKYFRNNVWWWRPLADYVCSVAPDTTAKCEHWHSNDGDGLDDVDSRALAELLEGEIASGRTEAFALFYKSELEQLPKEPCRICAGTGTRPPVPATGAGDPEKDGIKCNACEGSGFVEPWAASYPFDVDNVKQFAVFLKHCGGFEIC